MTAFEQYLAAFGLQRSSGDLFTRSAGQETVPVSFTGIMPAKLKFVSASEMAHQDCSLASSGILSRMVPDMRPVSPY